MTRKILSNPWAMELLALWAIYMVGVVTGWYAEHTIHPTDSSPDTWIHAILFTTGPAVLGWAWDGRKGQGYHKKNMVKAHGGKQ